MIDLNWAQSLDCGVQQWVVNSVIDEHSPEPSSPSMWPPDPWLRTLEQWEVSLLPTMRLDLKSTWKYCFC